jgi:hypothetical protein
MRILLQFVLEYLEVLYLNPRYRFTDSANRGLADIDPSTTITGDQLVWQINNGRGQINWAVAPVHRAASEYWFWVPLIRQYLEGGDESPHDSPVQQAAWLTQHLNEVEELFDGEAFSARACEELVTLRRSNSSKRWGWP